MPDFNEIGLNFQEVTISSGSRPHHCGVRAAFKVVAASLAAKYIQLKAEYIDAICYLKEPNFTILNDALVCVQNRSCQSDYITAKQLNGTRN